MSVTKIKLSDLLNLPDAVLLAVARRLNDIACEADSRAVGDSGGGDGRGGRGGGATAQGLASCISSRSAVR
eukprot:5620289-Pleurochrysis_carterae.AAC.2